MKNPEYQFLKDAGRILNAGVARTLILSGNIHDLFYLPDGQDDGDYVPLIDFLASQWNVPNRILLVYELNGPIRFASEAKREKVKDAWLRWKTGMDSSQLTIKKMLSAKIKAVTESLSDNFDSVMGDAIGKPTVALELLRQLCLCSRSSIGGEDLLQEDLIIIVEGADLLVPDAGGISSLSDTDRHRVSTCQDWFSDPGFMSHGDSVILVSESRSLVNQRIARLPQVLEVEVPSPDEDSRKHFIAWFNKQRPDDGKIKLWGSQQDLARFTAGLTIHALRQLLIVACHEDRKLTVEDVIGKVEEFIQSQLGEDVVEFKKPEHTLKDVVGFKRLREFLEEELIPRFRSTGPDALPGAAVAGPIGGGKTFLFEAVASDLGMVVLVLKSIRSQWFGQTDVIFERLRRVLESLSSVLIFVDEADTQFGGVGEGTHETERRLTGKIQAMMSDPKLRGRAVWLLMTARIHLLSPDIRRPGRVGDLIIPILDPEGEDRRDFLRWVLKPVLEARPTEEELSNLEKSTQGYSAAAFASLRSELIAKSVKGKLDIGRILEIVADHLSPAIGATRRYQTLQALRNCTRRSLLPDPNVTDSERASWEREIAELEASGIR
jgi:ATP-dependent 26S proteasome regulatory subunit